MENTPGGLRSTYIDTKEALEEADYSWNQGFDRGFVNHSFIPSLSAMGGHFLPPGPPRPLEMSRTSMTRGTGFSRWHRRSCTVGPVNPLCMFDEFRAPVSNQNHVTVTQQNKQWFLDLIHAHGPRELPLFRVQPGGFLCFELPNIRFPGQFPITALYGYDNPNSFTVNIPIGANNRFAGQDNLGQPENFLPGSHVEYLVFSGLSWRV